MSTYTSVDDLLDEDWTGMLGAFGSARYGRTLNHIGRKVADLPFLGDMEQNALNELRTMAGKLDVLARPSEGEGNSPFTLCARFEDIGKFWVRSCA